MIIKYDNNGVEILKDGDPIEYCINRASFCTLKESETSCTAKQALAGDLQTWNARLDHIHTPRMRQIVKSQAVTGLPPTNEKFYSMFDACMEGKMMQTALPKTNSVHRTSLIGVVLSEVSGLVKMESNGGAKGFVTFTDNTSKWKAVGRVTAKHDAFACSKNSSHSLSAILVEN